MFDREKLRARVRALLAKTVENGCTEKEAVAAAAKAAELMREYTVSEDELDIIEASTARESTRRTGRERLWGMVSHVTNCAALYSSDARGPIVCFYGIEPGPQIAVYLRDICNRAIDTEIAIFKTTDTYRRRRKTATRRQAVKDFTHGMIERLNDRLWSLFEASMNDTRQALAKQARDNDNPDARAMKPLRSHRERFADANAAGWRAGGSVDLHHGVGGSGEQLKIGGGS